MYFNTYVILPFVYDSSYWVLFRCGVMTEQSVISSLSCVPLAQPLSPSPVTAITAKKTDYVFLCYGNFSIVSFPLSGLEA
jgi:hypothetical protein